MTDATWSDKEPSIKAALQKAMRGFWPQDNEAYECVFWRDEPAMSADPRVILNATQSFEQIVARTKTENDDGDFDLGTSTIVQFDLDVMVESVETLGQRTAQNVGSCLRLALREDAVQSILRAANVKLVGHAGALRYLGRDEEERRIQKYIFTVPMRTELFRQDPAVLGVVESVEISGTLTPPTVNVEIEVEVS